MRNWFHLLDKSSSVDRHEILIIKKDMETIRSRGWCLYQRASKSGGEGVPGCHSFTKANHTTLEGAGEESKGPEQMSNRSFV